MSLNPKGCHCYKIRKSLNLSCLSVHWSAVLPLCCIFPPIFITFITQVLPKELDFFEITPRQTSLISQVTGGYRVIFQLCAVLVVTQASIYIMPKKRTVSCLPSCAVRRPLSAQIPQSLSVADFFGI